MRSSTILAFFGVLVACSDAAVVSDAPSSANAATPPKVEGTEQDATEADPAQGEPAGEPVPEGEPGTLPLVEAKSGTRLRAVYLVAGQGKQLLRWHDDARKQDCAFARAADGKIRCLPADLGTATPDAFVEAQIVAVGTGRLVPSFYATADGAQQLARFTDAQLGGECTRRVLSDRAVHCVPRATGSLSASDATCQKLIVSVLKGAPAPRYTIDGFDVLEVGARWTGSVYTRTNCPAQKPAETTVARYDYYLATKLPPSTFVGLGKSVDAAGRPRASYDVTVEGLKVFATWSDPDLGQSCSFKKAPDGPMRCIPMIDPGMGSSPGVDPKYTRADCAASTRLLSAPRYAGAPGYDKPVARLFQTTGAPLEGVAYYWQGADGPSDGPCPTCTCKPSQFLKPGTGPHLGTYRVRELATTDLAAATSIAPE